MRIFALIFTLMIMCSAYGQNYDRNKAVPVEKVLFGHITSVRHITERELIKDKNNGWQVFGGALIGGAIGSQFGSGSGRDVATILGALIGASSAGKNQNSVREKINHLVELMIKIENGDEYMVIQDRDKKMPFKIKDAIRMIYLANGSVRIDKYL